MSNRHCFELSIQPSDASQKEIVSRVPAAIESFLEQLSPENRAEAVVILAEAVGHQALRCAGIPLPRASQRGPYQTDSLSELRRVTSEAVISANAAGRQTEVA